MAFSGARPGNDEIGVTVDNSVTGEYLSTAAKHDGLHPGANIQLVTALEVRITSADPASGTEAETLFVNSHRFPFVAAPGVSIRPPLDAENRSARPARPDGSQLGVPALYVNSNLEIYLGTSLTKTLPRGPAYVEEEVVTLVDC